MLRMYYFSGTGNARRTASWMVDAWRRRGHEARLFDISKVRRETSAIGPDDAVAVASPTHGFNFPPITLAFLFHFPRARFSNRVMILNTRAGVRFFGVCLPGLSGVAQLLTAVLFLIKGYRVVGMRPVDLPSNWISIHPGLCKENIDAIYTKCEAKVKRSAERWLDGRRDYRALYDVPVDTLLAPISLGYYLVGRFVFAKSFIASRQCTRCGLCVKQCPIQAIEWVGNRPFWTHRCESCMLCMNRCPERAIETAHGFLIGMLVLIGEATRNWILPRLFALLPVLADESSGTGMILFFLKSGLMLLILFLSYRVLHFLLRFSLVERLVYLTSLTHFKQWRRYFAPKSRNGEKADGAFDQ